MNSNNYTHPEDAAALRNLKAIPGFPALVKKTMEFGYERAIYGENMASRIRLSPTQLPKIYNRLPPICQKLGISEPEFYLEMDPIPNANTFGDTHICLRITSGLLEYLDEDEIDSVIAHECGHIACHHVLYHNMANLILSGFSNFILGTLMKPFEYALLYWYRKSELSADRAAALVSGVDSVVKTQVRLSGGPKSITKDINIQEWAQQANEYENIRSEKLWDKTLQTLMIMNQSHPYAAVRVREILQWGESEQYESLRKIILKKNSSLICPKCHQTINNDWKFCMGCGTKL